jgi:3-oxoacyl-[acyl-carrier protein] reductase
VPATPSAAAAALVTGASRGLGRGVAHALAADGLDLAVHYGRNRAAAEETMAACRERATRADQKFILVAGDIASTAERRRIVDESLAALGRLDALVNNAGIAPRVRADVTEATEDSFDELIAVNLKGPYFLSQLVARHWLAHAGQSRLPGGYKLVFVSSASAARASVNRGDYCISKAGLAMAAKLWATRLAADGVQVYEVRPGIMATDMTAGVKEKYDRMIAEGVIPQGRWGTAEDVGLAASMLLKGQLPFSTGEILNLDGGLHLERL